MRRPIAASAEVWIDWHVAATLRGENERAWLALAILLAAVSAGAALVESFSSPLIVQDDVRQFVFWMAQWREPGLFRGDLLADYFQSVSPWIYVAIYRLLDVVGIPPLIAAKLIPPVLIITTVYFAFRIGLAVGGHPLIAFLGAVMMLLMIIQKNTVFAAIPRGFALPVFLAVLNALVRRKMVGAAIAQFGLSGIYPQLALVSLGVAGFTVLRWGPRPKLDLSAHSVGMVALIVAATAAGVLPTLLSMAKYGPVVDLEQARSMAVFQSEGRTQIFNSDGSLDRLCGRRLGLAPRFVRCRHLLLNVVILSAPPIFVFWRRLQRAKTEPQPSVGAEIYLYVFVVAFIAFALAQAVLFKLHLPSRYIQTPMTLILSLCVAQIVGPGILWLLERPFFRPGMHQIAKRALFFASWVVGPLTLAKAVVWALQITPGNTRPSEPELISALAAMPPGTVVAGFIPDISFVPVFAKRTALFTREHSIPYNLGYYRQVEARMRDMVTVEFSSDPHTVADLLHKWSISVYLISKARLSNPDQTSGLEKTFVPDAFDNARKTRQSGPTALYKLAPACILRDLPNFVILDAACLIREGRA